MPRIGKIFDFLEKEHLDCVVIKDVNTIRYLTGFRGDSSILYADDRRAVLVTDGRYLYQARAEAKCCHIVEYAENIWHTVAELAQDAKTVGFDGDYFTYNDFNTLQELLCGKELKVIDLKYIRMVKDKRELELMWRAVKIADEAYLRLLDELQPGMTEKTLAGRLEYYMRSLGAEKLAFETIVASGERSALPHGIASDKEVEIGDFITFDFGAVYDGYHSDMTRTVVLGMANSWHKEIYTIVEEAQWRGLKNAKPGITGAELDAVVRDYITSRGYGENYVHGLGHGIGLEIHEMPNINKRGQNVILQPGMTGNVFRNHLQDTPCRRPVHLTDRYFASTTVRFVTGISQQTDQCNNQGHDSPDHNRVAERAGILIQVYHIHIISRHCNISVGHYIFQHLLCLFYILR